VKFILAILLVCLTGCASKQVAQTPPMLPGMAMRSALITQPVIITPATSVTVSWDTVPPCARTGLEMAPSPIGPWAQVMEVVTTPPQSFSLVQTINGPAFWRAYTR